MDFFLITLILATFLCGLVSGFLFAFAVVVMPGIARLCDTSYIRAFQVIDGVIQNRQPLFVLVWLGSAVALIAATLLGLETLAPAERWLLVAMAAVYVLGVQAPTFVINIPLNNRLQSLDADVLDEVAGRKERAAFEGRWNRSNVFRTALSCLVTLGLAHLLALY